VKKLVTFYSVARLLNCLVRFLISGSNSRHIRLKDIKDRIGPTIISRVLCLSDKIIPIVLLAPIKKIKPTINRDVNLITMRTLLYRLGIDAITRKGIAITHVLDILDESVTDSHIVGSKAQSTAAQRIAAIKAISDENKTITTLVIVFIYFT
jgi:hypothetical protein